MMARATDVIVACCIRVSTVCESQSAASGASKGVSAGTVAAISLSCLIASTTSGVSLSITAPTP